MDVSVTMQRKFQQSKPIVMDVPQILFIVRVLDIPVMPLRQVRTVQTVQLVSDSTGAVLGGLSTCPLLCLTSA